MMPSPRRIRSFRAGAVSAITAAVLWFSAGCQNVLVPKHRVIVDAIAAPDATKPAGKSYRLVAKRATVSNTPVQIPVLKACVDAALQAHGMFEPPPNVPPDLVIEVTYGRDSAPRALAAVRETYLQLSARANPQRASDKATGPEVWDVRVAVLGVSGSIETAMPLLSSVAAEHMGTNTGVELKVEVPQNSPTIEAIRKTAIRTLETQAQRVAAAQSGTAPVEPTPAPPVTSLGRDIQVEEAPKPDVVGRSRPASSTPRAAPARSDAPAPAPAAKTANTAPGPTTEDTPR